jgi:aryl-alcohol dehydrogenase-like predicted oxidoreductase
MLETGPSRRTLQQALDASLARLDVDYVDIMWAHWPDLYTPTDEVLRALDDVVRSGKVLHVGLSNFPAWRIARGAALADQFGWAPIAGAQFEYSLADRSAERDLIPMAGALGISSVTWSPLGGGLLTGKYRHSSSGRLTDWQGRVLQSEDSSQRTAVIDAVATVAEQTEASAAEVAMAWIRSGPRSDGSVIPVVGPRTTGQLNQYLRSLDLDLSVEHLGMLDEASAPDLGVPHAGISGSMPAMLGGIPDRFIARQRLVA